MASRPKKMAKRVTELAERARVLQLDMQRLVPSQYMKCGDDGCILSDEQQDVSNPPELGQAWRDAVNAAQDAYFALGDLAGILRERAGIEIKRHVVLGDWLPGDIPIQRILSISRGSDEIDTPATTDPASAESQGGDQPDLG